MSGPTDRHGARPTGRHARRPPGRARGRPRAPGARRPTASSGCSRSCSSRGAVVSFNQARRHADDGASGEVTSQARPRSSPRHRPRDPRPRRADVDQSHPAGADRRRAVLRPLHRHRPAAPASSGCRRCRPAAPVSVRVRNFETDRLKVNDADGNPVDIAAIVVWQVADTAQGDLRRRGRTTSFVAVQAESALRHVATALPLRRRRTTSSRCAARPTSSPPSSRSEVAERVSIAGVEIIEVRISHLAYAAEIAQAMLQRQQAAAVVAARTRIVEGAVGMVQMALDRLSRAGRRRARRGAPGRHGVEPARRALRRLAGHARRQHRHALRVTPAERAGATRAARRGAGRRRRERKSVLLRLDPEVHEALTRWAADDLRSTNAHIEWLLRAGGHGRRYVRRGGGHPVGRGHPVGGGYVADPRRIP